MKNEYKYLTMLLIIGFIIGDFIGIILSMFFKFNIGFSVSIQKFDPYLNIDPGTMSPYQHGEVFVTDDGAETDLDLGHYERFIDENLTQNSNVTSGRVYWSVMIRYHLLFHRSQ